MERLIPFIAALIFVAIYNFLGLWALAGAVALSAIPYVFVWLKTGVWPDDPYR